MISGIGGLLAQTGQNVGSQIGGAYGQLGADLGGMLSGVGAKRRQRKQAQEAQELLAKYQNNPAQLNAMSAKYATEGNNALAQVFAQAAQRAVAAQAKKAQQAGQAGLVGLGQVLKGASPQERQAILRDASGSLTAQGITAEQIQNVAKESQAQGTRQRLEQNVMAKIQRTVTDEEQKRSLMERYMGASEEDLRGYLSGLATSKKPEQPQYNFSEETILVNGKPTRVQVATNKADPTDKRITTIGEVAEEGGAESPKTLTQRLTEAGVPNVDLTTLEGAKQARRDIIKITGNASLANSIGNIIEDLTPLSVKEVLDIVRSTNPEFVEAENLRELTTRFNTLEKLSQQDIAGLSALIERTLTATTENDIKAVSELERFRKAKDLPQRIKDFALEITTGRLSEETIAEYSTLAAAFEELATLRMSRALDSLSLNGSEKEADAARRARNMILGESSARIIN